MNLYVYFMDVNNDFLEAVTYLNYLQIKYALLGFIALLLIRCSEGRFRKSAFQ